MSIKLISASTAPVHPDLKKSIAMLQSSGIQGLQFDFLNEIKPLNLTESGRKQLLYQLTERTFKLASVYLPFRKTLYEEQYLDARVEALEQAILFASSARCPTLLFRAGRLPVDLKSSDARRLLDILDHLAATGNQHGVTPVMIPCLDTPETMIDYVSNIKSGLLGIEFDPAVIVMSNFKPVDFFMKTQAHIHHISARDAVSNMDGMGEEVLLGNGEGEWNFLPAILNEKLQNTWINVTRTQGNQKYDDILKTIQHLKQQP